jgi:hypothetical protein
VIACDIEFCFPTYLRVVIMEVSARVVLVYAGPKHKKIGREHSGGKADEANGSVPIC